MENDSQNGMSEETALQELKAFVNDFTFEEKSDKDLRRTYPQILSALMAGKLVLDSEEPVYTLKEPIRFAKTGEIDKTEIRFKTRVTVFEKEKIARKNDLREDPLGYSYATMVFVMNLESKGYLDRLSKYDFRVCEQLCTLFV